MKEKIKKIILGYLPGFITGLIICGCISVIAATYFPSNDVTYDNTESGLKSKDVQGAIDELYTECTTTPAGDQIIEDAGLEKDQYECRYFFTGANPNNYITFNGEEAGWRIISVECDGTIKIMRINSIGKMAWDTSGDYGKNNWLQPASLNTYLNETYYNGLNNTAQSQIVAKDWSIGAVTWDNNNIETQINKENNKVWNGKIALPTMSEYLRTNSNIDCKTFSLNNDNYNICKTTTWMFNNTRWWTLSREAGDNRRVLFIVETGIINGSYSLIYANDELETRPSLYLSSSIKITGGTGTQNDPYEISL